MTVEDNFGQAKLERLGKSARDRMLMNLALRLLQEARLSNYKAHTSQKLKNLSKKIKYSSESLNESSDKDYLEYKKNTKAHFYEKMKAVSKAIEVVKKYNLPIRYGSKIDPSNNMKAVIFEFKGAPLISQHIS